MITLGSCTMKLNPVSFMIPVTYDGFSKLHPFSPKDCTKGYEELTKNLE
jgi:glycine dehydrogenase